MHGDSEEDEVSTVTRAKQLAEQFKATAWKVLWDLRRILAVSLLALAGKTSVWGQSSLRGTPPAG